MLALCLSIGIRRMEGRWAEWIFLSGQNLEGIFHDRLGVGRDSQWPVGL